MTTLFTRILTISLFVTLMPWSSFSFAQAKRDEPILIDHTCRELEAIPSIWIEEAKNQLRLCYGHTSHGSQPVSGMHVLMDDPDHLGLYDFNTNGAIEAGVLSLEDTIDPERIGYPGWTDVARDYLDGPGTDRNVALWSWCNEVGPASEAYIADYLHDMNQLELEYPGVTFVYMTGHVDGTDADGNLHARNEQIRAFCLANNKVLYDFGDIERYDPDGTDFLDIGADDGCNYDGGNWAEEWCAENPGSELCIDCVCSHSHPLNCNLKGRAFWWMLARLAGWLEQPDDYAIAFQPSRLEFNAVYGDPPPAGQSLDIWRVGSGTLDWTVNETASWLSLSPLAGSSTGEHDPVAVSVDHNGLAPGVYNTSISIVDPGASNSPRAVPVQFTVSEGMSIAFQPAGLAFNALPGEPPPADQILDIWLVGSGTLDWTVNEAASWLSLSPPSGSSTGEHDPVTVSVEPGGLAAGVYNTSISIAAPGATNSPQVVPVQLTVSEGTSIAIQPTALSFSAQYNGLPPNDQLLDIWRAGSGTLEWTVSDDAAWLNLAPLTGSSTGEHDQVTVSAETTGLNSGNYSASISITAPGAGNSPQVVPVTLVIIDAESFIAAGPGPGYGNPPEIRVYPPGADFPPLFSFMAYGSNHYGANVCCGSLSGGTGDDILTGAGPGDIYGPHVRGFHVDGTPLPGLSFIAYGTLKFGVNVSAGDLDGDGYDEIITGAGPGAVFGPHVRAFDYDGTPGVAPVPGVSYFAYSTLRYGVNISAGDLDGDGYDEIVTGAGPGSMFGPHVRGWNVDGGAATAMPELSFLAYATFRYGVRVACGDLDGDGLDEIVTAPGPSAAFGAHIRGWDFDGTSHSPMPNFSFFAWPPAQARYGATVFAGTDLDSNGRTELLVGTGPDPEVEALVNVYRYSGAGVTQWFSLQTFPAGITAGTNVTGGRLP